MSLSPGELSAQLVGAQSHLETGRSAEQRLVRECNARSLDATDKPRGCPKAGERDLCHLQTQSALELENRQHAIEGRVKPLRESPEKMNIKTAAIERARASAYGARGEQLKNRSAAENQLQVEASKLSSTLRATTLAASWGNRLLGHGVEMADELPYAEFSEQRTATAAGLRIDLGGRLPDAQRILVDGKVQPGSYRAAITATDQPARSYRRTTHAQKVRAQVPGPSPKNYWDQFQSALKFAVLPIPDDYFCTTELTTNPAITDRALPRRILWVTPTDVIASPRTARYGWKQESFSKNADKISTFGWRLCIRIPDFADSLENIGDGLANAANGYDQAVASFESTLLPGARKFADLDAKRLKDFNDPITQNSALWKATMRGQWLGAISP